MIYVSLLTSQDDLFFLPEDHAMWKLINSKFSYVVIYSLSWLNFSYHYRNPQIHKDWSQPTRSFIWIWQMEMLSWVDHWVINLKQSRNSLVASLPCTISSGSKRESSKMISFVQIPPSKRLQLYGIWWSSQLWGKW